MLSGIWDFIESVFGRKQMRLLQGSLDICTSDRMNLHVELDRMIEKMKAANELIYQLQKTDKGKAQKIVELQAKLSAKNKEIQEQIVTIESLKTALALEGDIVTALPQFLDPRGKVYLPYLQFVNASGQIDGVKMKNPCDLYAIFDFQKELVMQKGWRKLSKYKKLIAIWAWVVKRENLVYEYDYGDNWQDALASYYRKKGDCEDGTVLFVSLCRAIGIRPDEAFNAVGPTRFGYHSFPLVYLNESDAQEAFGDVTKKGWYIFESTLDSLPNGPKRITDDDAYHVDAGLQNWAFSGAIRPAYYGFFNGIQYGTGGERRIENSKKKHKEMNKYWGTARSRRG